VPGSSVSAAASRRARRRARAGGGRPRGRGRRRGPPRSPAGRGCRGPGARGWPRPRPPPPPASRRRGRSWRRGLGPDAGEEGLVAAEAVPGAVVDLGEAAGRPRDRPEEGVTPAVGLIPEHLVHEVRGLDEEGEDLAVRLGEGEVGGEADRGVLAPVSVGISPVAGPVPGAITPPVAPSAPGLTSGAAGTAPAGTVPVSASSCG
jgi:hypothetical protein